MTSKQLHKVIVSNCSRIADLIDEINDAVEEFGDEELFDITYEWIHVIKQCIGEENNESLDKTVTDTLEILEQ